MKLLILYDLIRLLRLFWIVFSLALFVNKSGGMNEMYCEFGKKLFSKFALSFSEWRNMTSDNASCHCRKCEIE